MEIFVYNYAFFVIFNTCGFTVQSFNIRLATSSEKNCVKFFGFCNSIPQIFDLDISTFDVDKFLGCRSQKEMDSVLFHLLFQENSGIWIVSRKEMSSSGDHVNFCTQSGESLAELTSNGSNTNDQHLLGLHSQVEDIVRTAVLDVFDTWVIRNEWASTRCNASFIEINRFTIDLNLFRPYECCLTHIDINAIFLCESLGCVMVRNLCSDLFHPVHKNSEIYFDFSSDLNSEFTAISDSVCYITGF